MRTDPGWQQTLEIYEQKARDVSAGKIVLLEHAPAHVPVLVEDVVHMLEALAAKFALLEHAPAHVPVRAELLVDMLEELKPKGG